MRHPDPGSTGAGEPAERVTSASQRRRLGLAISVPWLILGIALPVAAWGGKVRLTRKYRAGQKIVYDTKMHTKAEVNSEPPGLKDLLPPLPTEFRVGEQNTITVQSVRADGSAEIQNRFDRFEVQSDLPSDAPDNAQDAARETQQEFGSRVVGHAITALYDRHGRLVEFKGADEMLNQFDPLLREPLRQALQLLLEHMGGSTLYPDHPVGPGEEWKRSLNSEATGDYPFRMTGESTLHYLGKTQYRGVKAAIVDFQFTNVLTPELRHLKRADPLAQLQAHGLDLEMHIDGQGQGRALLALDDGRVLQNHVNMSQILHAGIKGPAPQPLPPEQPIKLEIHSQTELQMEGSAK